jgi:hypothetical protein
MENTVNIFLSTASRVPDADILQLILEKQQNVFDIQPYKIESAWGENVIKLYLSIKNKLAIILI